jgi:uncharacterized delta-60 repeat protein
MKKVSFLFLLLCSFSINAQVTQQWVAKYNGPANKYDSGDCIAVDKQGNVYVTGFSTGTSSNDDYLTIKYNSEGVEQWTARYNGPDNKSDDPTSLAIDNKGNVYVTGYSYGNTYADYATVKYNSAGVEQWVARYNGTGNLYDEAYSIAVDKDGNVYVTGDSWGGSSGYDYVTIKYNPEGVQTWLRIYDGPGNSSAVAIKTDDAANVYVTGFGTIGTNQDIMTIKYNSAGDEQWVKRFDGPTNSVDAPNALAVDNIGDVYVCGFANTSATTTANHDFVTIKYNGTGGQEWVRYYNGTANANDIASSVAIDITGNIIVTGSSFGSGSGSDIVTIKYNSQGVQQWTSRYNGTGNSDDWSNSVITDTEGNSYVTGATKKNGYQDYITIKYNPEGAEVWVAIYNGPGNRDDCANASTIDDNGNIYVTGFSYLGTYDDYITIKYSQESKLSITKPVTGSKFIAGQKDTIRWTGEQAGQIVKIEYSTDKGNTYNAIVAGVLASSKYYSWDIPEDILTTKAKIRITDFTNGKILDESGLFGIKPYVLTRLNEDSTYYVFRKDRDQFGFSNIKADMWPKVWYDQFNYQATDPFTGKQYPQGLSGGIFATIKSVQFPDWVSWVNAYSVNACYLNTGPEVYSQAALLRWKSNIDPAWGGSCFGIAAANALAFSYKEQFKTKFPNFSLTASPIDVISDFGTKSTVNELFTQQYGKLTDANDLIVKTKTPTQILQEIKQMLSEDNAAIKTLSIYNNGGSGGHTILAYGLKQDPVLNNIYYVQVYDNSNPNSNNPITFDLSANSGKGSWSTPDWPGWGGNKGISLEVESFNYLNYATKGKKGPDDYKSPFIIPNDRIEIFNNPTSDIRITDYKGKITGYYSNMVYDEIPNSIPLIVRNGSETPPYGFSLPTDAYSIEMNNFHSDTVNTFFFTGNKTFLYQRNGATQTQADLLNFINGGVQVINNDSETKTISLLNLINETIREKLCIFKSLKAAAYDAIAIGNPDSNRIKITTYFTAQHYDIELNYLTGNGIGKFVYNNITLPEASSHIIVPDWTNLNDSKVMVLVDLNNDQTIDDTLYFSNLTTGIENIEELQLLRGGFNLSQNYPNPFNTITSITYKLPTTCNVTLKVFDLMGNEVATLVDENNPSGYHTVEFNALLLPPGIYFYRLQSGNIYLTKKMILRR